MSALDPLLASYLDLARHLDPLRHPHEAPAEVHSRLGRFDVPWLAAQAVSLKAIANAIEDLEEVQELADEVDRTMLINTVRLEALRLTQSSTGALADHGVPIRHAIAALDALLGEDFTATHEAALRSRLAELPGFFAALREDQRPGPRFLVDAAMRALSDLAERLDAASERLDEAAVLPAREALLQHHEWLAAPARLGGKVGLGEEAVDAQLQLLGNEPVGAKGTFRILELRRTGVERSLAHAAQELGYDDDWRSALDALPEIAELDPLDRLDAWEEEWERSGIEFAALGLPIFDAPAPPAPMVNDRATLGAWAVRARGAVLLEAGRAASPRGVRRLLVAQGLRRGWSRTVAALLRETAVLGTPERRLASAELALRDAVAAECDLLLQTGCVTPDEAVLRVANQTGLGEDEARDLVASIAEAPFDALASALAHEGWQGWFAEMGGDPAAFLRMAAGSGGLAVSLARWSARASSAHE